jgi:hypothetical protein
MSQTGEDWDHISISLSSAFPLESPTSLPKPNGPWVLSNNQYRSVNQDNNYTQQQTTQERIDKLEGVEYLDINIPSFLKLRTLEGKYSIKSNSTVFTFPIKTVELATHFQYYCFPKIDQEVYLVAQVTGWDTLGFIDGVANISFAGNNVGKTVIKFSESKDTLLLPIGKDNSVFISRSAIADQTYFKENKMGKKPKTTLAYKFELKNNNPFPIQFELVDQVPISQTKSAGVEIEKTSNGNLTKETGEITWLLDLTPGLSISKELIFTIEMEGSYKYNKKFPMKKYTAVSCPSF